MSDYTLILTTTGLTKIADAIAHGTSINLSNIAFGDSNGAYYEPTSSQTTLVHEVKRITINNKGLDAQNPNKIVIEGFIPAADYGYQIREMGLFDNTGAMLAVKKYPFIDKVNPSTGALIDLYIKEYLAVSNTSVFNLSVDANVATASINYVQTYVDSYIIKGHGTPEGVVTSTILGQLYEDLDNKTLYMKGTATGNTGWQDITGKQKKRITQTAHGLDNHFCYCASDGLFYKAQANLATTTATHFAVKVDTNTFDAYIVGDFPLAQITDDSGNALVTGEYYYLSNTVAGKITKTKPNYDLAQCVLKTNKDYFNLEISDPQYIGRDIYNCPPIGQIFDWGLSVAPPGAVFAQGQTISAPTYSEFRDKIIASNDIDEFGVTKTKLYQWGDVGHTLIVLPSLCGRVRIGAGAGSGLTNRLIGEISGEEKHQLTVAELAAHTHNIGSALGGATTAGNNYAGTYGVPSGSTGGDQAHNNMQPYIAVPVCIQLKYVTGVDPAIFSANASTLEGFHASAFALANGNPSNLFEAKDGASGKQVVNISQFSNLLGSNGYTKLPNGLILQWGIATVLGNSESRVVTLPVTFTSVVKAPILTADGVSPIVGITAIGTSSFTLKNYGTTGQNAYWQAIGY